MLRYAITDAGWAPGAPARWVSQGIDYVQLREKSLAAGELLAAVRRLRSALGGSGMEGTRPRLLINGRVDVALAAGAEGVHLTARPDELSPSQVRELFLLTGAALPVVSVSCHTLEEVERARAAAADLILFGPVFEKRVEAQLVTPGQGLCLLSAAAALAPGRVLALGGVTAANAGSCMQAGAAGIAAIRLFA